MVHGPNSELGMLENQAKSSRQEKGIKGACNGSIKIRHPKWCLFQSRVYHLGLKTVGKGHPFYAADWVIRKNRFPPGSRQQPSKLDRAEMAR